jgi:hypothetical protein
MRLKEFTANSKGEIKKAESVHTLSAFLISPFEFLIYRSVIGLYFGTNAFIITHAIR